MNAKKYRRAEIRALHTIKTATRYAIVKDRHSPRRKAEYYTGNHESAATVWSSDPHKATLYDDMLLVTCDLMALADGRLPEGRQGVKGKSPYDELPLAPDEYEDQPR